MPRETVEQAEERLTAFAQSILHLFSPPDSLRPFAAPRIRVDRSYHPAAAGAYVPSTNTIELYGRGNWNNQVLAHELCHAWVDQFDTEKEPHGLNFQRKQETIWHLLGWGTPPQFGPVSIPAKLSYGWAYSPAELAKRLNQPE